MSGDGFDVGSSSSSETSSSSEVESSSSGEVDYGDGDGVNDFDESYDEMQEDSSDFDYDDGSDSDASEDFDTDEDDEDESDMSSEEAAEAKTSDIENDVPDEDTSDVESDDSSYDSDMSSEEMADAYSDEIEDDEPDDVTEDDSQDDADDAQEETSSETDDTAEDTEAAEEASDETAEDNTEDTQNETNEAESETSSETEPDNVDEADSPEDNGSEDEVENPVDDVEEETDNDVEEDTDTDDTKEADDEAEDGSNFEGVDNEDGENDSDVTDSDSEDPETEDETQDETDEKPEAEDETQDETDENPEAEDETQDETDENPEAEDETQDETQDETDENTEAEDETQDETDENSEAEDETQDETQDETDEDSEAEDETQDETDEDPESEDKASTEKTADETGAPEEETETEEETDENSEADDETEENPEDENETEEDSETEEQDEDNSENEEESDESDKQDETEDSVEDDETEESKDETEDTDSETEEDKESNEETDETQDETEENPETEDETQDETDENAETDESDENSETDEDTEAEEAKQANAEAAEAAAAEAASAAPNDLNGDGVDDAAEAVDQSNPQDAGEARTPEAEKNVYYDNASYNQGQNDLGALGTCGPTSIANALNRVTGTNAYSENQVLHKAFDNDLCNKSDNPYSCGGTTTGDVVRLIDKVKDPDSNIETSVYDFDNALSVDELADRLDDPKTVAMVGVDSATLWDQRGDVTNSGLFGGYTESPSDHWITVDSPVRDENGNVTGFNVIDSGGGVDFVSRDKFERMYTGDANHRVTDPTAVTISNNGQPGNAYTQPEGLDKAAAYKESSAPVSETDSAKGASDVSEKTRRYESENPEMADAVRDITSPYYEKAGELARHNDSGRLFTDHKEDHVEMVAEKSLEAGDAIKEAIEKKGLGQSGGDGRVTLSPDIDKKTLEGAALSHDTGMAGDGYALSYHEVKDANGKDVKIYDKNPDGSYVIHREDNSNFNEVRENHSLNSALNVLENREKYREAGYSDTQIDKMAAECMAHSKSSSGVSDLNSKSNWSDCFDRMDAAIDAYNADHPDAKISFDRSAFEENDEQLGSLASETLALRVGDVSRSSGPDAEAHSGEAVHVDRTTLDNRAESAEDEVKNANISIGENGDRVDNEKSRTIHAGEQNIINNSTYVGEDGLFTHEVTVADGTSAPNCTQNALKDHIGEMASAKGENFDMHVIFEKPCDEHAMDSYMDFKSRMATMFPNVNLEYHWK